jgi:hypothetical protein
MSRTRTYSQLAALMLAMGATAPAYAATCGMTGTAVAFQGTYDPFDPQGFPQTTIALDLTRINLAGGEKTARVSFWIEGQTAAANGTSVRVDTVQVAGNIAGAGYDIFYDTTESKPVITDLNLQPTATNQFLWIDFTGGNAGSNTARVNFTVTLPPNLDLAAGVNLPFDVHFVCSTTGGGQQTVQTGVQPNAVNFNISVRSALQATFAGTALDFGEIGDVTTAQVTTTPNAYKTPDVNYVRVQSSGPYSVQLVSANGYYMTAGGGSTAPVTEKVGYELRFLSDTRSPTALTTINRTCARAGVGTDREDQLHLQARLKEGGAGKVVSANYRDTLTVTITPLAAETVAPTECAQLQGTF